MDAIFLSILPIVEFEIAMNLHVLHNAHCKCCCKKARHLSVALLGSRHVRDSGTWQNSVIRQYPVKYYQIFTG